MMRCGRRAGDRKNQNVYYENDSSTRGRHRIYVARPFESNKVECAERAISKLTLASRRKPSLAHIPCAEFIVIGVFDRGRIKGKKIAGERFCPSVTPPWELQSSPSDPSSRPRFAPFVYF